MSRLSNIISDTGRAWFLEGCKYFPSKRFIPIAEKEDKQRDTFRVVTRFQRDSWTVSECSFLKAGAAVVAREELRVSPEERCVSDRENVRER